MRRALLVALLTAGLAGPAHAFVQTLNSLQAAEFWGDTCIPVTIYLDGFDHSSNKLDLDVAGIVKSVAAAAHAWSTDAVTCRGGGAPFLEIVPTLAPLDAKPPPVAYDAKSTIIFRMNDWPYDDDNALAHTSPWPAQDGRILDVDIEVNAFNPAHVWMNLDPGVVPPPRSMNTDGVEVYDLQAVLTHEFGHFIGLAHTCFGGGAHLRDNAGNLIPDCDSSMDDSVSVMRPQIDAAQTSQRTLTDDDIDAVCTIYAASKSNGTCTLDTPAAPACAVAPRRQAPGAPLTVGAAFLAGVLLARRRRKRVTGPARARS
jgi:hypothetical protein